MGEMTLPPQTQDSKIKPWRSEAEHATSRSRRLPTILSSTSGWGRNIFVSFKPPISTETSSHIMQLLDFYAFQSFFSICSSYFISGFGAGNLKVSRQCCLTVGYFK